MGTWSHGGKVSIDAYGLVDISVEPVVISVLVLP